MSHVGIKIGIVGLPNVGKSTLFNLLTKSSVQAENYPFCTIEPNVGIVPVPDERLFKINEIVSTKEIIPSVVEFVDIAGLVKGASKGEGLGNQFLANISEVDAILHVLRGFEDLQVTHVEGRINPKEDLDIVKTEIALKDIETINKFIYAEEKRNKISKAKDIEQKIEVLKKIKGSLESGIYQVDLNEEERLISKSFNILSLKPEIFLINVAEDQINKNIDFPYPYLKISIKFEKELVDLQEDEKRELLSLAGIGESGLNKLIRESYSVLDLISYFTEGPDEIRSWTVMKGTKAPDAAGVIHTDFIKNFIRLEVVSYEDFIKFKGWNNAKDAGVLRSQGKDYIVNDGDILVVRHS